ncbi:MAG TPA: hypothetical protein VFY41_01980 [Nitrososphaeraceae archaeon]|nr:hypothetical protein [Nitrososphaeraceae archaeon]
MVCVCSVAYILAGGILYTTLGIPLDILKKKDNSKKKKKKKSVAKVEEFITIYSSI